MKKILRGNFIIILNFILISILCFYLQVQSQQNKKTQPQKSITFKTYKCIDKEGIGIEAFRMLIPAGWQFEGGIKWTLQNPAMPAVADFKVKNPNGNEEFQVFPKLAFYWTNDQGLLYTFPVGSNYLGNEVRQPVEPIEALKNIVIPRYIKNASNLKIIKEENIPEFAKLVGGESQNQQGVNITAKGGKIKIEYTKNSIPLEEEIYGLVVVFTYSMPTMVGVMNSIFWAVDYIFSFKSAKGKLTTNTKLFQTIAFSFKINQQWFNKYNQVVNYLVQNQIQQIKTIGQISKIISQTSNEISDTITQTYNKQQKVYDEIGENFSQYIRGVDEYYNPLEKTSVELPTGYNNVWANNLGEYVLSEDANFNPNISSNKNWTKINKK